MTAYYNEFDPQAAAWLRELIARGLIAPGVVDERSIEDVTPDDLRGFTQCHFFTGIGVWSRALRSAGWPDDRPVWTGSCPCQPFSAAGKGGGFDDERHLWPAFHWLISQCRPDIVFGEQVASKDGLGWLDLVQADLEGTGYASGAVDLCAASVGAPHIRQRLWWVGERLEHASSDRRLERWPEPGGRGAAERRGVERLANDDDDKGLEGRWQPGRERAAERLAGPSGVAGGLADTEHSERWAEPQIDSQAYGRDGSGGGGDLRGRPGPTNGLWRDADWLFCRDGKWRPVRPSAQQMVDGSTASLGRLRDSSIRDIEAAVEAWAQRHQRDGTEAVRNLWDLLSSEEVGQRQDGGFDSVRETPFLLALLRQLSDQGWKFPLGDERASSEASRTALRVLRFDEQAAYSSRGRGLDEQQPDELTDPLRKLSQIVAHFAEDCWGLSSWKNVGSFPLAHGAPARVARLRGYGNAIVAPAAQAFIEAYLEARADT